jgi:high affinity choline transporter 7
VAVIGLTAIVGAVTSSFSASILSAGSMLSWNVFRSLLAPEISATSLSRVIRLSIVALGAAAAAIALRVQSVQQLWFFTSDLVFVLLFPQLVYALFDPRANRTGSIVAFCVSLVLRLGGGEPILAIPPWIPYTELFAAVLPGPAQPWLEGGHDATLFPVRTFAALVGLVLLPLVSRFTARWDPPSPIPQPGQGQT